jgi:hypothetical protein
MFLFSPQRPDRLWLPDTIFPAVKRPEREADHLPASSAEVKNGAISALLMCLRGIVLFFRI